MKTPIIINSVDDLRKRRKQIKLEKDVIAGRLKSNVSSVPSSISSSLFTSQRLAKVSLYLLDVFFLKSLKQKLVKRPENSQSTFKNTLNGFITDAKLKVQDFVAQFTNK